MIDKNVVTRIVDEWLEGKDYFLVDVTVSPDDKIVVEIDHAEGVWIDDCVELSRYIESKLDREEEDYGALLPVRILRSGTSCTYCAVPRTLLCGIRILLHQNVPDWSLPLLLQ